jgi:hypothetical protein
MDPISAAQLISTPSLLLRGIGTVSQKTWLTVVAVMVFVGAGIAAIVVSKAMTSLWAQGLLLNLGVALAFFGVVNLVVLRVLKYKDA